VYERRKEIELTWKLFPHCAESILASLHYSFWCEQSIGKWQAALQPRHILYLTVQPNVSVLEAVCGTQSIPSQIADKNTLGVLVMR
jgi:hypothetical protein